MASDPKSSSSKAAESNSKTTTTETKDGQQQPEKAQPQLSALEEDDEFEEFPVQGSSTSRRAEVKPIDFLYAAFRLG